MVKSDGTTAWWDLAAKEIESKPTGFGTASDWQEVDYVSISIPRAPFVADLVKRIKSEFGTVNGEPRATTPNFGFALDGRGSDFRLRKSRTARDAMQR